MRYFFVERTLCLFNYNARVDVQEVTVVVSTASRHPIDFGLELYEVEEFVAEMGVTQTVSNVAVSTPVYKYVDLSQSNEDHFLELK